MNERKGIVADLVRVRLSLAVTFSSVTGYFIFHNRFESSLFILIAGVFFLAAGASALNQFLERRVDALMLRTKTRPLPRAKINPATALIFSFCLLISGTVMLLFNGILPALLGILNVVLYNGIYTSLKKITMLAVIPGAAVGAVPPLIGYTAAGGTMLSPDILIFSAFMFLWQVPHFWLILIKHREDYKNAGIRTIALYLTDKQIRGIIFLWVLLSMAFLVFIDYSSPILNVYLNALLIPLNLIFIVLFYRLLFKGSVNSRTSKAYVMINSFGLLIMIIFIINSFL